MNLVMIGGSKSHVPFLEAAHDLGVTVEVIDHNPNCPCADLADVFHCWSADETDRTLEAINVVDGVFTYSSHFGAWRTAYAVAYRHNLNMFGQSKHLTNNDVYFSKGKMNARLRLHCVPMPQGMSSVTSIILKPDVQQGGSTGIRTMGLSSGKWIVEEFIEGPEYSVNGFWFDNLFYPLTTLLKLSENHLPKSMISLDQDFSSLASKVARSLNYVCGFLNLNVIVREKDRQALVIDVGRHLDVHVDQFLLNNLIDVYEIAMRMALGLDVVIPKPMEMGKIMTFTYGFDAPQSTADITDITYG